MRFSVSIDILSAQKGAKLLPTDTFPFLKTYCDSGLDGVESPGILTIVDGPEHDELSRVCSHLSSYHVGSRVPAYP